MTSTPAPTPDSRPNNLGKQLRERRTELGLTLKDVAERAGLSVGFISLIERDRTVPSLSSLVSVARVLGLPLGNLLERPSNDSPLTRSQQRPVFSIGDGDLSYERLSTHFPGNVLRSVLVHEPPGHRAEPISHDGEEMVFVIAGTITVEIDHQVHVLGEGDSVHFESTRTHSTWNHGTTTATVLWVGTMDVFGEGKDQDTADPLHRGERNTNAPHNGD